MAGTHAALKLRHMSTGKKTNIPVVVLSYPQTARPNFSSTDVFARPDPLFTYQNTKRSFQCTVHTCPYEFRTKIPKTDIPNIDGYDVGDASTWNTSIAKSLAAVYQMMYPALRATAGPGVTTPAFQLQGPPILEITIPGVLNPAEGGASDLIFVPETFEVTKLADTNKINLVVQGPQDLKYLVPAEGYSFTLGGTVLHRNMPPGYVQTTNGIQFTDPTFPFGVDAGGGYDTT